jgi:helix-turn-helix protein
MQTQSNETASQLRRKPRRLAPPKPLAYTVNDVCRITGLGVTMLYLLMSQGRLRTVTIGRRRLVLAESIEELLQLSNAEV